MACTGVCHLADNRHLLHGRDGKVERTKDMPERLWMLRHEIGQGTQVVVSPLSVVLVSSKGRQAQQYLDGDTVARRSSIVHDILGTANQSFVVTARIEKASVLLIGEQGDRLIHQSARL